MIMEGAVGVEIVYIVKDANGAPVNMTGASNRKIVMRKPDKTRVELVAQFDTDGADGALVYTTTVASELTPAGAYRIQPFFTLGLYTGSAFPALFTVHRNV